MQLVLVCVSPTGDIRALRLHRSDCLSFSIRAILLSPVLGMHESDTHKDFLFLTVSLNLLSTWCPPGTHKHAQWYARTRAYQIISLSLPFLFQFTHSLTHKRAHTKETKTQTQKDNRKQTLISVYTCLWEAQPSSVGQSSERLPFHFLCPESCGSIFRSWTPCTHDSEKQKREERSGGVRTFLCAMRLESFNSPVKNSILLTAYKR